MIPGIIARVDAAEGINIRLHAVVSGRVQGVSFRYYAQIRADELGVVGWVRNRPDGTVEVTAEGTRGAVDRLLGFLQAGPPAAAVAHVEAAWLEPTGEFTGFSVRY